MDAATAVLSARGLVGDDGLTAEGTALRDGIEDATDRMVQPVVDAIGDDLPGLLEAGGRVVAADRRPGLVPARPLQARLRLRGCHRSEAVTDPSESGVG